MSIEARLNDAITKLEALRADAVKTDSGQFGAKSANKRFRKNLQTVRADLKELRTASLSIEG